MARTLHWQGDRSMLPMALLASLALHASLLSPRVSGAIAALWTALVSDRAAGILPIEPDEARPDEQRERTPPPPTDPEPRRDEPERSPEEVRLGIEKSDHVTLTWIGYDEWQEQLARRAEIEQAAMRLAVSGDEGKAERADVSDAGPDAADLSAAAPPESAPPVADPAPEPAPAPTPPPLSPAPAPTPSPTPTPEPAAPQPPAPPVTTNPLPTKPEPGPHEPPSEVPETIAKPEAEPTAPTPLEPPEGAAPAPPATNSNEAPTEATPELVGPPAPEERAAPAGLRVDDPVGAGEITDAEADAASVVAVPSATWRNGRPLAAQGLHIKTRKPKFTILTMVTASPKNPVVEIRFDHDGKPASCEFLRRSGHPDIDGPIRDALAGWRASGAALEKLKPGETVAVKLRLVLVQ